MSEVKDYFLNGRREDKRELRLTKEVVRKASSIFPAVIKKNRWPYELLDNESVKIPLKKGSTKGELSYSQSTNAMILFSIMASSGLVDKNCPLISDISLLEPLGFEENKKTKYQDIWDQLINKTKEELETDDRKATYSDTFGINDPFTLAWLLEISKLQILNNNSSHQSVIEKVTKVTLKRLKEISEKKADNKKYSSPKWLSFKDDRQHSVDHTFIALRYVQLGISVSTKDNKFKFVYWLKDYFESNIHEQLSRYEIRDGDFDAAELVFALEGALHLNSSSVSSALIERIFHVITQSQKKNPYWRPVKPIVATPQGRVLFPLSVETACSLIRSCSLIEKHRQDKTFFSNNVDLFRRYTEWLRSRMISGNVTINKRTVEFHGWHSEHVHMHRGIHLWETSNVILYLQLYVAMLEKHIARKSLESANLKEEILWNTQLSSQHEENIIEPLQGKQKIELQPYEYAKRYLIAPRNFIHSASRQQHDETYSVLLYGPPGTGKTVFAEEICKSLKWPLITVTPSDFIHGGENEVESRAKRIFDVLEDQFEAVVLFDEIDRMILDRASKKYTDQGDIFQFMTPSMLTKLRNLRKKKRIIFVIATNYKERIDPAAIRPGRLDIHLLMPPPDKMGRIAIFKKLITHKADDYKTDDERKKALFSDEECSSLTELASITNLYTYIEIKAVFDAITSGQKASKNKIIDALKRDLCAMNSAGTSLQAYKSRIFNKDDFQKPMYEFLVLLYLYLEGKSEHNNEEIRFVNDVFLSILGINANRKLNKDEQEKLETQLKKDYKGLDSFIIDIIKAFPFEYVDYKDSE